MNRLSKAVALLMVSSGAFAQRGVPSTPPTQSPPEGTISKSDAPQVPIPWPMQMGIRSMQVRMRIATVDQVVLVPDAATYLDEISRWTLRERWPVLIEDDFYAPMFVRSFKPARVVRRTAVAALPTDREARRTAARTAVAKSWTVPGGGIDPTTPAEAFAAVRFEPLGIVLTSMDDPAWTAGVALASGHGQALLWLEGNCGGPNDTLEPSALEELSAKVEEAARATSLPYAQLGDTIDAVTIARTIAPKAVVRATPQWRPPRGAITKPGEPVAVTDALCRNEDGSRWAIAGWIFGNETRAAYGAMCSLYLSPKSVWEVNTYPTQGDWAKYGFREATPTLAEAGFEVEEFNGVQASVVGWLNMLMGGFTPDILLMNTKGNMDFFEMFPTGVCYPEDVPFEQKPIALHLIHSWSLTSPQARMTVGGRWLEHGTYAYAGSVYEPFLAAFVPPVILSQRIANYVPFLVACRWGEGESDQTWRVTTIGDPLFVTIPPSQPLPPRLPPSALDAARGESDLRESARDALINAKASGAPADYARALDDLVKAGDDAIATQVWTLAAKTGGTVGMPGASVALGPLFRERNADGFLKAYRAIDAPSDIAKDMLWQLWTQQLGGVDDPALLQWFSTQVRPTRPAVDLARLAPEIVRVSGADAARAAVAPWIDRTPEGGYRTKVREVYAAIH
ncbi:MAG: hypothetical protein EXS03_02270 [Phycisphaerales bacterium]|nr:hypothetical protein [Phycisphaerales bacterium]